MELLALFITPNKCSAPKTLVKVRLKKNKIFFLNLWGKIFVNKPEIIKGNRVSHWSSYYWFEWWQGRNWAWMWMCDKGSRCLILWNPDIGFVVLFLPSFWKYYSVQDGKTVLIKDRHTQSKAHVNVWLTRLPKGNAVPAPRPLRWGCLSA
jgi:hypothetical protein